MPAEIWQIVQGIASVDTSTLRGRVEIARPDRGLVGLELNGSALGGAHLLGVTARQSPDTREAADFWSRQQDLVVTYPETDACPLRLQVYWRIQPSPHAYAMVDLIVSAQTSSMGADATLSVSSSLESAEVLSLVSSAQAGWSLVPQSPGAAALGESKPGCHVLRLVGCDVDYAEMVHPSDYQQTELRRTDAGQSLVHQIFSQELEKGVLLRGRLRGVFLKRTSDARLVASIYEEFAASEPPLTV